MLKSPAILQSWSLQHNKFYRAEHAMARCPLRAELRSHGCSNAAVAVAVYLGFRPACSSAQRVVVLRSELLLDLRGLLRLVPFRAALLLGRRHRARLQ